jgi:hypothetical protein
MTLPRPLLSIWDPAYTPTIAGPDLANRMLVPLFFWDLMTWARADAAEVMAAPFVLLSLLLRHRMI